MCIITRAPGTQVATKLGNTQPGDGVRFKGRGYIQLTGRDNYQRIGRQDGSTSSASRRWLTTRASPG
jgi:predicted chitinase